MSVTPISGPSAIRGLARLLHPLSSQQRMLAVMAAYSGQSCVQGSSHICALAGYVARGEEWGQFERRWRNTLQVAGIQGFQMFDFEKGSGDFAGWPDAEKEFLLEKLIHILKACGLVGVGSALASAASPVFSGRGRGALTFPRPDDPYSLCFQHGITEAAHCADGLPPEEKVSFVFDWDDPLRAAALWLFDDLKKFDGWQIRQRLGTLGFESKLRFAPLQAADWLAFACYRQLEESCGRNPQILCPHTGQLLLQPLAARFLDRDAFRMMVLEGSASHIPEESRALQALS